jgi:hypothetical protein
VSKTLKQIMREISPESLQRELQDAHHEIDKRLGSIITQLRQASDSTFGDGKPWGKASYTGFGDRLIAHGKCLVDLGENFNSGKLPQWLLDQQSAYEKSIRADTSNQ